MISATRMADNRGQTAEERDYYGLNTKVYAVFAPYYDLLVKPIRRMRERVASLLEIRPDSKVLDVATGTGAQAFAFARRARDVVGVDLSEAMLRIARRKNRFANVTFRNADATDLPFDDGTFDVTCISFALHEMPNSVRRRVVHEMVRVTKDRGAVVIVDYSLPRNVLAHWVVYHFVKLYEGKHYAQFLRLDLDAFLSSEGIEVKSTRSLLAGLVQAIEGHRAEATGVAPRATTNGSQPT